MIDPLGVLTSCKAVVESSVHVRIDDDAVTSLAQHLVASREHPEWDAALHYRDHGPNGDENTAMWMLVLDALNFCFWPQGADWTRRWRVEWHGELVDGYTALVAALTRAVVAGYPLHDANWLAVVSSADVASLLAPAEGHTVIPLFDDRVRNLRELGQGLLAYGETPATAFIQLANGSATDLVNNIVRIFPSFNDVTVWTYASTGLPNSEVRFYKRAQILAGDLAGGLAGSSLAEFNDLHHLTAFADYKVPQILRAVGVLVYDDALSQIVDSRTRIAAGSRQEIEIRAATIIACDRLVEQVNQCGVKITAAQLDWHLWSLSQHMPVASKPYHLTETIYY